VVRAFRFANTHRIEARIESFNLLNWFRPQLAAANLNRNATATFGRITSVIQNSPRAMQFAVKYSF
jgi:hypothetical protein